VTVLYDPRRYINCWIPSVEHRYDLVDCVFIFIRSEPGPQPRRATASTPRARNTFLEPFLRRVSRSIHKSYAFVGLEGVPRGVLEAEFGIGKELQPDDPQWHSRFQEAVFEAVDAIPEDEVAEDEYGQPYYNDPDPKAPGKAADRLEVLTMDEYRKRVGEEAYVRETFADRDRNFVGILPREAQAVANLQTPPSSPEWGYMPADWSEI
jgi:hypothetical protein